MSSVAVRLAAPSSRPRSRLRGTIVLAAGVLLVIAASAVGLHDVAEAHLGPATAQHAADR